jgi:predicted membrane channel-forming protein YqfA (hemolysin III family)
MHTLYLVHYSGFFLLFVFAILRLPWAASALALDKVGTVFLLTGLGALCTYNARLVAHRKTDATDIHQRRTRLVAHACMLAFFILTLLPFTLAVFQPYDWLALIAHTWMVAMICLRSTVDIPPVVLLLLYFFLSAMDKMRTVSAGSVDTIQVIARLVLVVGFGTQLTTQLAARQAKHLAAQHPQQQLPTTPYRQ